MINVLLDTQFLQRQHTADTQQDLLFDTVLPVSAVELVGDLAVPFAVQLVVRVQQIQVHTAYSHLPQVCLHHATRVRHLDHHVRAVRLFHLRNRQVGEVLRLVVGDLLAFRRKRLREIAVAIEETDGGHIYVAVRRLLDIIARENTQTARINLQHMAQTVFHREISDTRFFLVLRSVHISAELGIHIVQLLHEFGVFRQLHHPVVTQNVQQYNRVGVRAMPCLGVDIAEEIFRLAIPRPPEVVRELLQFA